ncbi:MAG TPA: hypothetical protein VLH37_00395 [Bacteroidales bacterium]|nr:hypothetical protein [Bacteroidales bacterium]
MKQVFVFFFCLLSFISKGQELEPLKEIELADFTNGNLNLEQGWSVSIGPDPEWMFYLVEFQRFNQVKLVDSVELYVYEFSFRLLQHPSKDVLVVMVEVAFEHLSYYPVYLIQQDAIRKIGNFNIRIACDEYNGWHYPLDDINVKGNNARIEFSFGQAVILLDRKYFPKFDKNEIRFVFDFTGEKLRIETDP